MKIKFLALFVLSLSISCNSQSIKVKDLSNNIVFQPKDKEILQQIFTKFGGDQKLPTADLVVKVGTYFLGTPYVGHTLEGDTEKLVVNLRELDCTTFGENCLAISRTIRSGELTFDHFAKELKNMRYRQGIINGYTSRIHYFSDWIYTNNMGKLIQDISQEIGQTVYPLKVNYMSSHPRSYKQLTDHPELIPTITDQEKIISQRKMYYIPESRIKEVEDKLHDGDIAGITTTIGGMDISHVVILVRREGRIHILHASSMAEKVIISEETLEEYLFKSKSATGIMVARPL
jgi:hypothetical protein